MAEVAAVGDSRSDIPLFRKVGLAIALNATPKAREAAHIALEGNDLTIVLEPILRGSRSPGTSKTPRHSPRRAGR